MGSEQGAWDLILWGWGVWGWGAQAWVHRVGVHGARVYRTEVHGAGVHRAGPGMLWLQQFLELPMREDAAVPVPTRYRGQEDTRMRMRCPQGWDNTYPLGN